MRAWLLAIAVVGCGGTSDESQPVPSPLPGPVEPEPAPPAPPDFPDGTRSLELRRTVGVRLDPSDDAKRIGNVAIDTRVAWVRTQAGRGCDRPWIEIRPRGWICGDYVEPSKKPPYGQEVPHLDRGELVPGIYGKVTAPASVTYALERADRKKPAHKAAHARKDGRETHKDQKSPERRAGRGVEDVPAVPPHMVEDKPLVGSVNVRQYEEVAVGGRLYWKIDKKDNEYVLAAAVTLHHPSAFGGVRLGDDTGLTAALGFVAPRWGAGLANTMNTAQGGGVNRQLAARTPLAIVETALDKAGKPTAYRIGAAEWIAAADTRVFQPAPPPALLLPGERWIDVDIDDQILVAYEGDLAVYATLVSSGGTATPTETGVYRVWLKESEADMKGLNGEDPYSVATVPWTEFFSPEKGLALHTAYWHDQFGTRRSHGCVNLAPRDARWLYFWSDPQVPAGWTMAAGMPEAPGSIVRIRTKDDPAPEAKGYAKKVLEARQQNAPIKG
ncbi:MAG TPA: L,D-transpeptidase [Kofleriaceae bacterium]|jgi:lipoprotein-anchoring transpeptidase ErfK/SrfK|nr:L,D-transpeptidase [Kofleriaceae bacterium]